MIDQDFILFPRYRLMTQAEKAALRREIESKKHPPITYLPPAYRGDQRPVVRGSIRSMRME